MFYRYGTIFREIVSMKPIDLCEVFDGRRKDAFINGLINLILESARHLIHKCPYMVSYLSEKVFDDLGFNFRAGLTSKT